MLKSALAGIKAACVDLRRWRLTLFVVVVVVRVQTHSACGTFGQLSVFYWRRNCFMAHYRPVRKQLDLQVVYL